MVKSDADGSAAETTATQPTRQRKWHPRVFTGCVNCRRRHVKCDERTPSCTNCTRLSLPCNFDRRFVFKAVPGGAGGPAPKSRPSSSAEQPASSGSSGSGSPCSTEDAGDDDGPGMSRPGTPGTLMRGGGARRRGSDMSAAAAGEPAGPVDAAQTLYYQHFLGTVAALLIVYDTPGNANPYRMLPQLVGGSALLQDTMTALGAMHLAGMTAAPQHQAHRNAAVKAYGSVVARLRDAVSSGRGQANLELLATSLLLCMFEMMSAGDGSWRIHLLGAAQIFHSLYSPRAALPPAGDGDGADALGAGPARPLRRFLVSVMAHLDVAAACATGDGALVAGDYWESLGGGWEYNLGAPSFVAAAARGPAARVMAQLRAARTRVMAVQVDISRLAKLLRAGLDNRQQTLFRGDIAYRLDHWHRSAPDIFARLDAPPPPPPTPAADAEALTAAACIQSYALACSLYLERVCTRRVGSAAFDPDVRAAVDRIMALAQAFSTGVDRLALLWALLSAGIATVDPDQQRLLRAWLTDMKAFGFQNVCRVLDTLEYSWEHMRRYGGVNYDEFEAMIASNLVP